MKMPSTGSRFVSLVVAVLAGFALCALRLAPRAFAADEICTSCGQQVSVNGSFTHRKDRPSVTIEGTSGDPACFREDVNGTNFSVTISHLPAGKYTINIGAAETAVSARR